MGDEKWENLFWHQRQKEDGELKNVENNVTKDLLFFIRSPECLRTRDAFTKFISTKIKISKKDLSEIIRVSSQISDKELKTLPKKDAYLLFLSKSTTPNEKKPGRGGDKIIIDAMIEYNDVILFLEAKTDSKKDPVQLKKYAKKIEEGGFRLMKRKREIWHTIDWDELYGVLSDAEKKSQVKIEKFLIEQYLDCLRVMRLTDDFYGFYGNDQSSFNHDVRCLINFAAIKSQKGEKLEMQTSGEKGKEREKKNDSWVKSYFGKLGKEKSKNLHFTTNVNLDEFKVVLTLHDPNKKLRSKEIWPRITKIASWNKKTTGQKNYGRTVYMAIQDYKSLKGGQLGPFATRCNLEFRLDRHKTPEDNWKPALQFKKSDKKIKLEFKTIQDFIDTAKQYGAEVNQIQIGFEWNKRYTNKKIDWKNPEFCKKQLVNTVKQLEELYYHLRDD